MLKPLGLLSGKALGAASGGAGSLDELHGVFPKEQKTLKVLDGDGILSCPWSAQRSLLLKLLKDTWIEITEKEENLLLPFPSL